MQSSTLKPLKLPGFGCGREAGMSSGKDIYRAEGQELTNVTEGPLVGQVYRRVTPNVPGGSGWEANAPQKKYSLEHASCLF